MTRSRLLTVALAALLAFVFFSQGASAPFEKDEESRPAAITLDIMRTGHWLLPRDIYGEATRKPPLYYWLSAALLEALHAPLDETGARAVSIVAAAALAAMVMTQAETYFGAPAGWLAWLALLACYGFSAHGAYARTDMLFTLLTFAAYCLMLPEVEADGGGYGRALFAGIILGLAVLTKGPLAIVLCALAIAIDALWQGNNPLRLLARRGPWLTLASALAIAALWYVPAFWETSGGLFAVQMGQENLGHFLPGSLGGTGESARPVYYILIRFLGASLPLCLYFPALVLAAGPVRKAPRPLLYHLSFVLAVLGLFSLAAVKRDDYILPAFPSLAIALGYLLGSEALPVRRAVLRWRDWGTTLAALGTLAVAGAAMAVAGWPWLAATVSGRLQSSDSGYLGMFIAGLHDGREMLCVAAMAAAATAALVARFKGAPRAGAAALALASMMGVSLWIGVLRPGLAEQRSFKTFTARMEAITAGRAVYSQTAPDYEISFYYGRPLLSLNQLAATSGRRDSRYLLLWSDTVNRMGSRAQHWPVLLSSAVTEEHRQLELLKIDQDSFESSRLDK
jgi:4-amino-4-deoxy-L-arabinose transferase-like glycosyltransferase